MRENDLIRSLRQTVRDPPGTLGIGDDCCVWTSTGTTCLSTDTVVEGRHFLGSDAPAMVGRKAAAAALSDLAAMGAVPTGAVVALSCPAHWDAQQVMAGLISELGRHACPLLGGDTTASAHLVITVTVWGGIHAVAGHSGRFLLRSGGHPGDLLVVTGSLGGSMRAGRHLRPEPRLAEGQWFAACPAAHAMMDLSDGLAGDAPKLAEASGCGCLLLPAQVPIHPDVPVMSDQIAAAMSDGEDYELLVAIAPEQWPSVQLAWPFPLPVSVVGWLVPALGASIEDHAGRMVPLPWTGYEHGG
jgi:thiamine-monophosphate kinase